MRKLAFLMTLLATPINAHEFWLEPHDYQVAVEAEIVVDLVNGQDFEGVKLSYLPQRFKHFAVFYDGKMGNVPGRIGDTPALQSNAIGEGLHIFAYQSQRSTVQLLPSEGLRPIRDRHSDRISSLRLLASKKLSHQFECAQPQ